MNISTRDSGYIVLITAAGLASKGHKVIGGDATKSGVNGINQRKPPIYVINGGDILKSLRECCEK